MIEFLKVFAPLMAAMGVVLMMVDVWRSNIFSLVCCGFYFVTAISYGYLGVFDIRHLFGVFDIRYLFLAMAGMWVVIGSINVARYFGKR